MNKKFMVVALMAALSTVGYAEVTLEQKVEENRVIATQAQNNAAHALIQNSKQDKDIAALEQNKVSKEEFDKKTEENRVIATQAQNNAAHALIQNSKQDKDIAALEQNKVSKEEFDKKTEENRVIATQAQNNAAHALIQNNKQDKEIENLKTQVSNNTATSTENSKLIGNLTQEVESVKGDVDFVKGEVERVDGKVTDLQNKVETGFENLQNQVNGNSQALGEMGQDIVALEKENDKQNDRLDAAEDRLDLGDRINKVQNQQIGALQTENVEQNNKIEALDKNKVDKDTYEEDKKAQADKDAAQDAEIAKGDRIDKVQNQQIGNLQSQNLEQDKNIQANKDAIAANKAEQDKVNAAQKENNEQQQAAIDKNTSDITTNRNDIEALQQNFAQYDGRLSGLEKKVDHLDDKMNKGLSLMAAMNAVDFQNVQTGEMALGAGIGHYGNAQSVALGVAYAPVEDLTVNAKYSVTAGDADSFAVGAGATYKFKVGR